VYGVPLLAWNYQERSQQTLKDGPRIGHPLETTISRFPSLVPGQRLEFTWRDVESGLKEPIASCKGARLSLNKAVKAFKKGQLTKMLPELAQNYIVGDILGQGSYGVVLSGQRCADKAAVAIKIVSTLSMSDREVFETVSGELVPKEVYILQHVECDGIIRLLDFMQDGDFYVMVFEDFGTAWDKSNPALSQITNSGFRFEGKSPEIKSRDLLSCIQSRNTLFIFKNVSYFFRYAHSFWPGQIDLQGHCRNSVQVA
jgi:serine/threonine protein kinase